MRPRKGGYGKAFFREGREKKLQESTERRKGS